MEDTLAKMIEKLSLEHDRITPDIIEKKNVKLGLRNKDGTGVIVGITTKGRVVGYNKIDKGGKQTIEASDGKLIYCNYDVAKLVKHYEEKDDFGFDEVAFLLLAGELPTKSELDKFSTEIAKRRNLSKAERNIILEEVTNDNQMYGLHSVISHIARCDPHASSIDIQEVSRQCINLIAKFPTIVAHNYNVMRYNKGSDLNILKARNDLSTAENFLYLLHGEKPDRYEAHIFDLALILHAEHGGGNNSTFTVRTVSSSGANTYMAITAGIASLSGHLHGGANESVMLMMKDLKKEVKDWTNEKQIRAYLTKLLEKKAGDRSGKIFGFGHAVYTLSDPRAVILKKHARKLAEIKGATEEFELYENIERIASGLLTDRKGIVISANVDFYSGFIYKLMGIPRELYTPIFAMARVVGWSAHRLEQIIQGKIMRPAYIAADTTEHEYVELNERKK